MCLVNLSANSFFQTLTFVFKESMRMRSKCDGSEELKCDLKFDSEIGKRDLLRKEDGGWVFNYSCNKDFFLQ